MSPPSAPAFRRRMRERLSALIRNRADPQEWVAQIERYRNGHSDPSEDRAFALVSAAFLERRLEDALLTRCTANMDDLADRARLFGGDQKGAIEGFAGKITVGFALGLYNELLRDDLTII